MDYDWTKEFISKLFAYDLGKEAEKLRDEKIQYINLPLYKYCYVCEDSARNEGTVDYNIDNFEKDILFFQNPSKFNDPFDCYLGFSQSQIIRDLLVSELRKKKKLTPANRKLVADLFKSEDSDLRVLKDESVEVINTIIQLLPNNDPLYDIYIEIVKEIFSEDNDILYKAASNTLTILDKQKLVDKMYSNTVFIEMIKETVKPENLDFILKAAPRDMKIKIENEPDSFMSENNGETYGIFDFLKLCAMSVSDDSEISVEQIDNIKEAFNKMSKDALEKSRKLISEQFRVTCLSERRDSPLMWSHYANKHFGFCLEYDFTGSIAANRRSDLLAAQLMLFPVHYTDQRPLLSKALFDGKYKLEMLKKKQMPPEFLEKLMYGLLFKSEDWSYEKEWRIFQLPDKEPIMKLPKARKVYLGANMEDRAKQRIIDVAKSKKIPVYQMFLKSDKYKFDYYQVL